MTGLRFRLTNIALDEEEAISELTAIVNSDTHAMITEILGEVKTTHVGSGGTEMTIVLPIADAMRLYGDRSSMPGTDPHSRSGDDIRDSLSLIYVTYHGLIAED